ncbi:transcription/translation regulatory transformer protein RfaH [Metapseudomonas furukawaii]|uniref:Transcriptional activator RfaH n=1 Tax=Metapseudomonas furukawaii TaxID=1149133 RepID=A0AAD1C338_METFU|nr:transcription/translation regulatory transformer protein RfaH [Pseudomonas furukawaii]ELS25819.1 Transcriptional activator RfaH [Pseudomonas furukawaii]BAU75932.1 transcriptional activator RfaH [Pseudomonas furukawaii]
MDKNILLPEIAWYLVQCKARQDERAQEHLQRQGFDCFCPVLSVESLKGGRLRRLIQPLFPGYLFVHLRAQDNWAALRSTRGVARVVSFSGAPSRVPDAVVEHLMSRCERPDHRAAFNPGDKVQVQVGPFAEMDALFLAMDGEQRVILLLNILNRQQQVSIPVSHLVA